MKIIIAYISSHSKGPEQDQLRSPFVPHVRNNAERSIHNFDCHISSLFLQVRFCPRLTSRRPILSYAARTKRKFSCPKEPVFETNYESFTLKSTFVRSVHISCTVPSRLEHDAAFLLCSFEGFCFLQGCAERCLCSCLCQSRHAPIFSSMSTMAV